MHASSVREQHIKIEKHDSKLIVLTGVGQCKEYHGSLVVVKTAFEAMSLYQSSRLLQEPDIRLATDREIERVKSVQSHVELNDVCFQFNFFYATEMPEFHKEAVSLNSCTFDQAKKFYSRGQQVVIK